MVMEGRLVFGEALPSFLVIPKKKLWPINSIALLVSPRPYPSIDLKLVKNTYVNKSMYAVFKDFIVIVDDRSKMQLPAKIIESIQVSHV